jgi:hypothetical protein
VAQGRAAMGGTVGAALGHLLIDDRWERARGTHVSLAAAPRGGGLGLSLSLRF